ncbi:MAG: hypothetical protein AAF927_20675 [Bacteroidota bacterium]
MNTINYGLLMTLLLFCFSQSYPNLNFGLIKGEGDSYCRFEKIEENKHCDSCDIKTWMPIIDSTFKSLTPKMIGEMICTIERSCANNSEFSSIANEYLFELLDKYPNETLKGIKKKKLDDKNYILKQIQNPVHDGIEIQALIKKLEQVDNKSLNAIKIEVLESLKTAFDK